jgi:hypothetical protein
MGFQHSQPIVGTVKNKVGDTIFAKAGGVAALTAKHEDQFFFYLCLFCLFNVFS